MHCLRCDRTAVFCPVQKSGQPTLGRPSFILLHHLEIWPGLMIGFDQKSVGFSSIHLLLLSSLIAVLSVWSKDVSSGLLDHDKHMEQSYFCSRCPLVLYPAPVSSYVSKAIVPHLAHQMSYDCSSRGSTGNISRTIHLGPTQVADRIVSKENSLF